MAPGRQRARGRSPLVVAALLALAGCAAPRPQPSPLEPTAAGIARAGDDILARYGGVYRDPKLQAYVDGVGNRIVAASPLPAGSVRFVLVDTDAVNAYAVPGATVFLTRGLLTWLNSEAELAGVIAHELAHAAENHVTRARLAEQAAAERAHAAGVMGPQAAAQASVLAFSRGQEIEADLAGLGYLVAAGYPGRAMADNLHQFEAVETVGRLQRGIVGDWPGGDETMATHPSSDERLAALAAAPQAAAGGDDGRDRYLAAIDGLPFGPRADDWQVAGDRMFHPATGIAFSLPPGYAMASSAGVLSGTGPGQNALIVDLVDRPPAMSPATYIDAELGSGEAVESRVIGGFPAAVIGLERAERSGRRWRALLAAIGVRDDALLRVLSVAPAEGMGAEETAFRAIAASLHRSAENAPAATARLTVHSVQAGETLASLAAGAGDPRLAETLLRALNALPPGTEPAPGDRLKVVRQGQGHPGADPPRAWACAGHLPPVPPSHEWPGRGHDDAG